MNFMYSIILVAVMYVYAFCSVTDGSKSKLESVMNSSDNVNNSVNVTYTLLDMEALSLKTKKNDTFLFFHKKTLLWMQSNNTIFLSYKFISIVILCDKLGKLALLLNLVRELGNIQLENNKLYYNYTLKRQIGTHINRYELAKFYYKSLWNNLHPELSACKGMINIIDLVNDCRTVSMCCKKNSLYQDIIGKQLCMSVMIKMDSICQNGNLQDNGRCLYLMQLREQRWLYSLCLFFILLILFISYSYYRYRVKAKDEIRLQQKLMVNKQKELHDIIFMQLKTERKLFMLQQEEIILRENFLKKLIIVFDLPFVCEKMGHIKLSSEDWNNIIEAVDVAFDGFTIKLKKVYPELTDLDVRFCCLLRMNLTIKELTNIYCLDKKSIYKKKERIKKDKMHSTDSRSLNDILKLFSEKIVLKSPFD